MLAQFGAECGECARVRDGWWRGGWRGGRLGAAGFLQKQVVRALQRVKLLPVVLRPLARLLLAAPRRRQGLDELAALAGEGVVGGG